MFFKGIQLLSLGITEDILSPQAIKLK